MLHGMIKQSSLGAAVIAGVMVFLLGLGHRALDARYGQGSMRQSVDSDALARLPHSVDDWNGQDVPLDERIVKEADIDTYINRSYRRSGSDRPILFYIGCGSRASVLGHYPDRCYLGSGWIPCAKRKGEMSPNSGSTLPYNVYKYTREGSAEQGISLFQLFVVDGEYYTDISEARRQSWGPFRSASYYAQVQIGVQSDMLMSISDEDEELLAEFTKTVVPHMNGMFAGLLEERPTRKGRTDANDELPDR